MKENILSEKSYKFALRMIKLCKFMNAEHRNMFYQSRYYVLEHLLERILKNQFTPNQNLILFTNFQSLKKKRLKLITGSELLRDSDYINDKLAGSMINDCEEIQKLLTASIRTAKSNL